MSLLSTELLPASFRGVPFAVLSTTSGFGRRVALHQYPGRDEPWAEDMGRQAKRYRFRGFLVSGDQVYAGLPVAAQRLAILNAVNQSGAGTLTHPTLGVLKVVCESANIGEAIDAGRYSEVEFSFVEAGSNGSKSLLTQIFDVIGEVVAAVTTLIADIETIRSVFGIDKASRGYAQSTAYAWSGQIKSLTADAASLRSQASTTGDIGRYAAGANAGFLGTSSGNQAASSSTLAALSALQVAADGFAAGGDPSPMCALAIAAVQAMVADALDPSDAIRRLIALAAFAPPQAAAQASQGAAMSLVFRISAALEMARAASRYQPASFNDAQSTMTTVARALDTQATGSSDLGMDATYTALRSVRALVVQDMRSRGADLPDIATFKFPNSLPSLSLAQRIYRDPARAPQLVKQADPPHPLFMPTQFMALAA